MKSANFFFFLLFVVFTLFSCSTLKNVNKDAGSKDSNLWKKHDFEYEGYKLLYQLYSPNFKGNEKIPLLIHLHGSNESGVDNEKQMYTGQNIGPDYFSSSKVQNMQLAYVLAPQTPEDVEWTADILGQESSVLPTNTLLALIDKLLLENPNIDSKRIYLAGLSRGGQGVWNLALQRPNLFAALVPMAGFLQEKPEVNSDKSVEVAPLIKDIAIWAFHSKNDPAVPVKADKDIVKALKDLGATVNYTELDPKNDFNDSWLKNLSKERVWLAHLDSWLYAFRNLVLWEWMIKQHK